MSELMASDELYFGEDGNGRPKLKRFLADVKEGVTYGSIWDFVPLNTAGSSEMQELFSSSTVFESPKPVGLMRELIRLGAVDDSVVLDFFAGSGSTAHAVLEQNSADGGTRRFICVQLPEPTPPGSEPNKRGFKTISDVTKERLRRAGAALRKQTPVLGLDLGFRVFKLDQSNIRAWNPNVENLQVTIEEHTEHLLPNRTEQDVLYELLLKLGLDLAVPIETRQIVGKTVHNIGAGALMVCLSDGINRDVAEPLALGIALWQKAQAEALQAGGDDKNKSAGTKLVFKDSAFADDVAKTNLAAILSQQGLNDVRSI